MRLRRIAEAGEGEYAATTDTITPEIVEAKDVMARPFKHVLLGNPIHTREAGRQRLGNPVALAVFSSDALSSVAYATEEILLMLVVAGTAALALALPISLVIGVLLVVVVASYRQTIKAYPSGGGAYIVAKENLGTYPGLVAGGSLLVDYILTVAVSISAGTAAITSAFPELRQFRVEIAVVLVVLLALANLRGVRESGAIFAGPTFFFVVMLALLIIVGLFRYATGGSIQVDTTPVPGVQSLTLFLILKAFSSGCTAMTGVEAIANGVQAFREPAARNARATLTWMGLILLFLFLGTTALARLSGVQPAEAGQTVISQLARATFGTGIAYYLLQAATAAILILAANTSYADFPRLGSFMAADGFLPKQLRDRGSRLVHSNGVVLLTAVATLLLVAFRGDTHRLIPLYAVGVFTSFTLSQSGMVVHWWRTREPRWKPSLAVNAAGAATTGVVTAVIAVAKFAMGAWIVVVLIPMLMLYFLWVHRRYVLVTERLRMPEDARVKLNWQSAKRLHNHVVVLVASIDRRIVRALQYARSIKAESIEAIFVDVTGDKAEQMRAEWAECDFGVRLTVIESPYREIIEPIHEYIRSIPRPTDDHVITVIVPEFVPEDWADNMLHDQTSFWIKRTLFFEPNVIVADVPYNLRADESAPRAPREAE